MHNLKLFSVAKIFLFFKGSMNFMFSTELRSRFQDVQIVLDVLKKSSLFNHN